MSENQQKLLQLSTAADFNSDFDYEGAEWVPSILPLWFSSSFLKVRDSKSSLKNWLNVVQSVVIGKAIDNSQLFNF